MAGEKAREGWGKMAIFPVQQNLLLELSKKYILNRILGKKKETQTLLFASTSGIRVTGLPWPVRMGALV
jgi:hypothetical protein